MQLKSPASGFGLQATETGADDFDGMDGFDFVNNNGRPKKNSADGGGQSENLLERTDAEIDIGCEHLGSDILVGWPYLYEARVERVIDGLNGEQHVFDASEGMIKQTAYSETPEAFKRQMAVSGVQLKEKLAIDIGRTCVALGVRRKIGYQLYYDNNGRSAQFQAQYEKEMQTIPLQLCVPQNLWKLTITEDNPVNTCGFALTNKRGAVDGQSIDVKSIFKRNELIFCTAAPFYGAVGQVLDVIEQQPAAQKRPGAWGQQIMGSHSPRLMVQAKFLWPYEPDMVFVRQNYQDNLQPNYWGARELSQYLQMHPRLVSGITGTLYVVHSKLRGVNVANRQKMRTNVMLNNGENDNADEDVACDSDEMNRGNDAGGLRNPHKRNQGCADDLSLKNVAKTNIGLNLKKNKTCKEVRGYSLKDLRTNQWLYSDRVAEVLARWRDSYPKVFETLNENTGADIRVELLFADDADPMESLREMQKFMNGLLPDTHRVEQSSGCDYIDDAGITELRRSRAAAGPLDTYCFSALFRPQHVFKYMPGINDNAPPDSRPIFRIWDRVVNARPNCAVPVGIRGTVVRVEYEDAEQQSNGTGNSDWRNNNNNNQSFQQPQPPNTAERRQKLIQIMWDELFKVNGTEADLFDLPPSYLINISYGRKLKEISGTYDNVKMQRTSLTVHDLTSTVPSKKHKLPDNEEAVGEETYASHPRDLLIINDKAEKDVGSGASIQRLNSRSSDADLLSRVLRKSSENKVSFADGVRNNISVSTMKSEALLGLEALIAATSNIKNDRMLESEDEVIANDTETNTVDLLGDSDDEISDGFESNVNFQSASGNKPDSVKSPRLGRLQENRILSLFQKKATNDVQGDAFRQQLDTASADRENALPLLFAHPNGDDLGKNQQEGSVSAAKQKKPIQNFSSPMKVPKNGRAAGGSSKTPNNKGNENGEEWVNSFRDDYFDNDEQTWQAPPTVAVDEADSNRQFGGPRGGRSRGGGGSSFRSRGDAVRGNRSGRGASTAYSVDDIYTRAQRIAQFNNGQQRGQLSTARQRGSRPSQKITSPSTREMIIDVDNMEIIQAGGFDENEWNEDWSKPLTTAFSGRGPRGSINRSGERGGFSTRGRVAVVRSSFGGRNLQHRSQQCPRNQQFADEDADDDDDVEGFNNGQWRQIVRSRGEASRPQRRPFDSSARSFGEQQRNNDYADDNDGLDHETKTVGTVTFFRKHHSGGRTGSARLENADRARYEQQRSVSPLLFSGGNQQKQQSRPLASEQQRSRGGGSAVPMPSNAAECVVYSVDDDYNYDNYGDNGFGVVPSQTQHYEAVYATPEPVGFANAPSPVKESQPSATSTTGSSGSSGGKAVLSSLIQQMNKKTPLTTSKVVQTKTNDDNSAMNEALEQLEKLSIDLPPFDEDEFPGEEEDNEQRQTTARGMPEVQQPPNVYPPPGGAADMAKLLSLGRNFAGVNFVSGGFLQSTKANELAAAPLPRFPAPPPPSIMPFSLRPQWRTPPVNVMNSGVDPAVYGAGAGVLHYRQPVNPERMRPYAQQNTQHQQFSDPRAAQAAYWHHLQQQRHQHQQQEFWQPRGVNIPPNYANPYLPPRPPAYMQRPPLPPPQFRMNTGARSQAVGGPPFRALTTNFPAQQQQSRAPSAADSRPTISMIPRSALLRNSIARRPESSLNVDED